MVESFLKLVNMSLTASWLIAAVLILRLLLRKAPKWVNCFLWCMVGIRLALPFSIESVYSLIPSAEVVPAEILYSETPAIDSGMTLVNRAVNPVLAENFAPNPGDSVNPLQIITFIAAVIWVVGIVLLLGYTLVSYVGLRRQVADAVRLKDSIFQSEKVTSPFVLGMAKPRIYVPYTLCGEELECVIAHEKAHIQRYDHLLKPIGFLVLTVYWFNPLVWVAYILLCRDIELACDEKVMRQIGMDKKTIYSRTLLSCSVSHKLIAACPVAFGENGVKYRIKSILNYKKPAFWVVAVSVLACVVCAVCFMTSPKEGSADANGNGETEVLQNPPAMVLEDSLSSLMNYYRVEAGSYEWHYVDSDSDLMVGVSSDAPAPQDAVEGQERLHIKQYYRMDSVLYLAGFSVEPDCVTLKEYDLADMGNADAEVISETVYEALFMPELKPRRIYEVIAEWEEANLEERGFYGKAHYAFATDNEAEDVDKEDADEGRTAQAGESDFTIGEKFTEEVNTLSGVTMFMEKYKATGGDVEFINETEDEFYYGDDYDIQMQQEGAWYSLKPNTEFMYHDTAYILATGSVWKVNWELFYGALPVGNYRMMKSVTDYRAPGDYTKYYLAAEFEIKAVAE